MKMQRVVALALLPVAAGALTLSTGGSAAAAPNPHGSCAAQLTTNPEFGPPGPAQVGGTVVSTVARGDRSMCEEVLFEALGL
jgi:hypothetical protein